jgi:hypothetical protein
VTVDLFDHRFDLREDGIWPDAGRRSNCFLLARDASNDL